MQRNRHLLSYALMAAALVAMLAACTPPALVPPPTATPVPPPLAVSLLHTSDTWGYVLPCG
jgi:hypothetical protein